MADVHLTQAEADALIAMDKHRVDEREWDYPDLGGGISIPLVSVDKREHFVLDVRRSRIDLAKGTYQNRGRQIAVLVRLDFGGAFGDTSDPWRTLQNFMQYCNIVGVPTIHRGLFT